MKLGGMHMETVREIMTPEQVADYLQLSKDTVYRYIREGKLIASRLGRNYRISKENVDLFLLATSTSEAAREALFDRWESVAGRNKGIPFQEVESDIAEAIAEIRHRNYR
jgi:excisionase family DNA binding protein